MKVNPKKACLSTYEPPTYREFGFPKVRGLQVATSSLNLKILSRTAPEYTKIKNILGSSRCLTSKLSSLFREHIDIGGNFALRVGVF